MNIVILGPQGAGKGTQAERVSKRLGVPHIDFGQLLRDHVARKTEIGKKIEKPLRQGELIPSALMDGIVQERIGQPDCENGFVFDGYPRQLEEAEFLDSIADIDAVIILEIPDELAVTRLAARRVCSGCVTPLYGMPKDIGKACRACGGTLVQREDDKPEAVKRRLELYHEETEPLIEYYTPRGILHRIDATGEIEDVFKKIMQALS